MSSPISGSMSSYAVVKAPSTIFSISFTRIDEYVNVHDQGESRANLPRLWCLQKRGRIEYSSSILIDWRALILSAGRSKSRTVKFTMFHDTPDIARAERNSLSQDWEFRRRIERASNGIWPSIARRTRYVNECALISIENKAGLVIVKSCLVRFAEDSGVMIFIEDWDDREATNVLNLVENVFSNFVLDWVLSQTRQNLHTKTPTHA